MVSYISVDGGQVMDGDRYGEGLIFFVGLAVFVILGDGPRAGFLDDEAVHKGSCRRSPQPQVVLAKLQDIENSLDPHRVKAVTALHLRLHRRDGIVQF